jgi:hypothetical protein
METHPGAMEAHPGAVEAHPGAVEAHPGAMKAHLGVSWATLSKLGTIFMLNLTQNQRKMAPNFDKNLHFSAPNIDTPPKVPETVKLKFF